MEPFKIHILGCGSALPTLRHNPSSQVVELRGKQFMIDCGEGTQTQMRRSRSALLQAPDGKKSTPRHTMDEPQQHDMSYNQAIVGAWERPRQAPMGL